MAENIRTENTSLGSSILCTRFQAVLCTLPYSPLQLRLCCGVHAHPLSGAALPGVHHHTPC
jgi:hypothetical protein